jgi:membrane protein DedA with SNARE-associated domain
MACHNRMVRLERGKPPRKWVVRLLVGLVIVSQASAMIGDLALAEFVDRHPAWLIALNPRNRNLALATNQLDALTYYGIGFTRLVASDPVYYLLGFWYGERAMAWVKRRSRTYGPLMEDGEQLFRRAAYPLIFAAPNNVICALSAVTGVRLRTFIILNLSGTVTRLYVVRRLGEEFRSPIQSVIDFIAEYRTPVLIVSAILVAWTLFSEFRGGDESEIGTLTNLARDHEEDGVTPVDGHTDNGDALGGRSPAGTANGEFDGAAGAGPETDPGSDPVPGSGSGSSSES